MPTVFAVPVSGRAGKRRQRARPSVSTAPIPRAARTSCAHTWPSFMTLTSLTWNSDTTSRTTIRSSWSTTYGDRYDGPKAHTTLVWVFLISMAYKISFIFMPPPFEEWWRGIKCYPCPCVRAFVRASVRPLSKFVVRSITFERLLRFHSNLVCLYKTSKYRSSSIWVTIHWFFYGVMGLL